MRKTFVDASPAAVRRNALEAYVDRYCRDWSPQQVVQFVNALEALRDARP